MQWVPGFGFAIPMITPKLLTWLQQTNCRPIVVASHPRSGTHLVIDTLRHNFPECQSWKFWGERTDHLYLNLSALGWHHRRVTDRAAIRILSHAKRPIIKTHAFAGLTPDVADHEFMEAIDPYLIDWLRREATFIYSYRDGREVLCSWHQMLAGASPPIRVPFSEFIRQRVFGVSRAKSWALHVQGWLDQPSVLCLRMEELLACPRRALAAHTQQLGLKLGAAKLRVPRKIASRFEHRLNRLFSLRPQSTAIVSPTKRLHWRQIFSPEDRQFFYEETGGMAVQLGYEKSADWVDPRNDPPANSAVSH